MRAVVTGASSGIGAAVARQLASAGHDLVITARRGERLEALAAEVRERHGVKVDVVPLDLCAEGASGRLEEAAVAGGPVDILVANAGIGRFRNFIDVPWPEQRALLVLDVGVVTELVHRFAGRMRAAGRGYIMTVGSIVGEMPVPGYATYAGSKAFVRSFSAALASELRGSGVSVTCVSPGPTESEFHERSGGRRAGLSARFTISAETCARIAVRAMLRRRRHVAPGFGAKLSLWLAWLLPRRWVGAMSARSLRGTPPP
jgi:short-subunit dehydrogenase